MPIVQGERLFGGAFDQECCCSQLADTQNLKIPLTRPPDNLSLTCQSVSGVIGGKVQRGQRWYPSAMKERALLGPIDRFGG